MKNKIKEQEMKNYYRQAGLKSNVTAAFKRAGLPIKKYTDTESMDEFHIRGRAASRELARLADLQKGMQVLDIGCGVGGPARLLAAEFGCMVTGVDLMEEYCETATMITDRIGLSHMVTFQQGDMTDLVFDDQSFDAVWTLHTIMNVENKAKLLDNVFRILKPGGLFALYEICAGPISPPYFPVPWASDASMSFLLNPDALCLSLTKKGFEQLQWQDVSSAAIDWFQNLAKTRDAKEMQAAKVPGKNTGTESGTGGSDKKGQHPGISLLMGRTGAEKSKNVFRNLIENRIRTVFGVFRKPVYF